MSQPAQSPTATAASPSSSGLGVPPVAPMFSPPESTVQDAGILIVDADRSFSLGLETFLKEFVGFEEVHVAANGLEALELLREQPSIEMVTLDSHMPEMDGMTFLERVKEGEFPQLAVVMITGNPSEDLEGEFKALNSDRLLTEHFLEKPVDFNDLESVILQSYESLKKQQAAAAVVVDPVDVGTGVVDSQHEESFEERFAAGPLLSAPDENSSSSSNSGISEVRARIDWMGDSFNGRLDQIEAKVENISARMPSMAERFWLGVLKWAALGLLAWAFVRFEVGDKLVSWYDVAKSKLEALQAPGPAANESGAAGGEKMTQPAPESESANDSTERPVAPEPATQPSQRVE